MSWEDRVIVNEDISPHKVVIALLIKMYLSNEIPLRRNVIHYLITQIEGSPVLNEGTAIIVPCLSDLLAAIGKLYAGRTRRRKGMISEKLEAAFERIKSRILAEVWSITSYDQLHHSVVESYNSLSDPNKITSSGEVEVSPRTLVGAFLQKMVVTLKLMRFEESAVLFSSFCHYRSSTIALKDDSISDFVPPKLDEPENEESLFDTWHRMMRKAYTGPQSDSQSDERLYKLLGDQLDKWEMNAESSQNNMIQIAKLDLDVLIDAQVSLLENFGTPTPPKLKQILRQMANPDSNLGNSCGLHTSNIPSYCYLNYLESLHSGDYNGALENLHQYFDYMVSKGSKYFYHFALISQASLHQHFHQDEKALDSIEEAISVARENKDNATLTYILSWLFAFIKHKPALLTNPRLTQNYNELRLLDFLLKKTISISLLLAATTYRYEAEYYLKKGSPFPRYYESLFIAQYVSINDHPSSFVSTCNLSSYIWEVVGFPHLSDLHVTLGLIYSELNGSKDAALELKLRRERCKYLQGDIDPAITRLKEISVSESIDNEQRKSIKTQLGFIQIECALMKGRKRLASELLDQIPKAFDSGSDNEFEITRLKAKIHASHENYSLAAQIVRAQISNLATNESRINLLNVVKLTMLETEILIQAGAPLKAFSMIVQQMEFARSLGMGSLLTHGFLLLIKYLNASGNFEDAYRVAEEALPMALCNEEHLTTLEFFYEISRSSAQLLLLSANGQESKTLFKQQLSFLGDCMASSKGHPI